jgi:hypothetical protein
LKKKIGKPIKKFKTENLATLLQLTLLVGFLAMKILDFIRESYAFFNNFSFQLYIGPVKWHSRIVGVL